VLRELAAKPIHHNERKGRPPATHVPATVSAGHLEIVVRSLLVPEVKLVNIGQQQNAWRHIAPLSFSLEPPAPWSRPSAGYPVTANQVSESQQTSDSM